MSKQHDSLVETKTFAVHSEAASSGRTVRSIFAKPSQRRPMFPAGVTRFFAPLAALAVFTGLPSEPLAATLAVDGAPGVFVIPPDDVLEHHTFTAPDGTLVFVDNAGVSYSLIEDPNDPEITSFGDGSFHPFDLDGVVESIEAIPFEVRSGLNMTVYVLPYPRRGFTSSSASLSAVFLCPGVYPVENDPTLHSVVTHEVGHSWQKLYLSAGGTKWDNYVSLRGIDNELVFYSNAALHAYRPGEIFAEDFRVLFGDAWAKGTGEVENPELVPPSQIPTLAAFFEELVAWAYTTSSVADAVPKIPVRVFPNPVWPGQQLTVQFGNETGHNESRTVSVIDVQGRVIDRREVNATGRLSAESAWGAGVFWLREDSGHYQTVRLNVLSGE